MEQEKLKDLCLLKNMAQELELSPWDVFMHWVAQGEIQKVTVNIAYKNGDVIEANVTELSRLSKLVLHPQTNVAHKNSSQKPENSITPKKVIEPIPEHSQIQENDDVSESDVIGTSIKHGTIHLKPEQANNIKVGAYVYSTGDILSGYKTLGSTQIKGIILSHSQESITIFKYVGSDLTAMDSVAQIKDDWRFLTYRECRKMVKFQDILNARLAEMRLKQIKDPTMLLYKEDNNQLLVMDVGTQEVHSTLDDKTIGVSRIFTVYLAKDLKIV